MIDNVWNTRLKIYWPDTFLLFFLFYTVKYEIKWIDNYGSVCNYQSARFKNSDKLISEQKAQKQKQKIVLTSWSKNKQ